MKTNKSDLLDPADNGLFKTNPAEALSKMRDLYVKEAVPAAVLCDHFGISERHLRRRVDMEEWRKSRVSWFSHLQANYETESAKLRGSELYFLEHGRNSSLQILVNHMKKIESNANDLTLKELEQVKKIHELFEEQIALRKGEVTKIVGHKNLDKKLSVDDVIQSFAAVKNSEDGEEPQTH